jgi:hypothetical protein
MRMLLWLGHNQWTFTENTRTGLNIKFISTISSNTRRFMAVERRIIYLNRHATVLQTELFSIKQSATLQNMIRAIRSIESKEDNKLPRKRSAEGGFYFICHWGRLPDLWAWVLD